MDAVDEPESVPLTEVKSLLATDNNNKEDTDDDGPIEHVSDLIGSWGPFQRRIFVLAILVYAVSPFSNASIDYYMIKSDFWCENSASQPISQPRSCDVKSCDRWVHNTTRTTLIKEWDLVCDRFWIASLALSSYQLGYLISCLVIGIISDRFGRRFAMMICLIGEISCFFAGAMTKSIEIFIVTRFISGIGGYGRFLAMMCMLVETVGPKLRGKIVAAYEWIWHVGLLLMLLVTYFVENFRHLYYGIACYQLFSLVLVYFKVPESIRWQLVTGKTESAQKTLDKFVRFDNDEQRKVFQRKFDKLCEFLSKHNKKGEKSESIIDIWRVPRLLKYFLTLCVIWFVQTFFSHGMKYNTLDLSGNYFINMAMIKQSSLLGNALVSWGVEKFNRKTILFSCMLIASISLFSTIPLADKYIFLRNSVLMIGNFVMAISSVVNHVYTAELFPTTMRQHALGSCSISGRIGSISAPFILQLNRYTSVQFTLSIFASLGILGALMSLLLPETRGKEIPDTVEDMIEITKKKENVSSEQEKGSLN
ncbi:organic cation transporter protein-like [Brevipalpus obovatus]|uniref:organic cation transporter protein-like n=1 Tax=Brevipalpus obovatus TaxID=246614 RepID=UPI003D9DD9C0